MHHPRHWPCHPHHPQHPSLKLAWVSHSSHPDYRIPRSVYAMSPAFSYCVWLSRRPRVYSDTMSLRSGSSLWWNRTSRHHGLDHCQMSRLGHCCHSIGYDMSWSWWDAFYCSHSPANHPSHCHWPRSVGPIRWPSCRPPSAIADTNSPPDWGRCSRPAMAYWCPRPSYSSLFCQYPTPGEEKKDWIRIGIGKERSICKLHKQLPTLEATSVTPLWTLSSNVPSLIYKQTKESKQQMENHKDT